MPKGIFRFYEELNEYLPPRKRKSDFEVRFNAASTVGEVIKEQGVPEGEVDLVLVNGCSVSFDHVLRDGDRVSAYPVFERFNVAGITRLRKRALRNLRFVAEKSLEKTAERLKDLGYDVCFDLDFEKATDLSRKEKRILLTTREELVKSGNLTHALYVKPGAVENQILGILEALDMQTNGGSHGAD